MSTIQDGFDLSNARGELAPESRLDIAVRAKKSVLLSDETPKIRYERVDFSQKFKLFRIEYVSTSDRKLRQFKDISITVTKPVVTAKPQKPKTEPLSDDQRDTNGSYYLFIGENFEPKFSIF